MKSFLHSILTGLLIGCILVLPVEARRRWVPAAASSAPSYTLLYDCYTVSNFGFNIGDTTNDKYIGTYYVAGAGDTISKITFKLTKGAGSITGKTYKARLWSTSGSAPNATLNAELAVSSGIAGDDSWSATSVDFIFVTPYTETISTPYAWTISEEGTADASNYAAVAYNATAAMASPPPSPELGGWRSGGSRSQTNSSFSSEAKVYKSP